MIKQIVIAGALLLSSNIPMFAADAKPMPQPEISDLFMNLPKGLNTLRLNIATFVVNLDEAGQKQLIESGAFDALKQLDDDLAATALHAGAFADELISRAQANTTSSTTLKQ